MLPTLRAPCWATSRILDSMDRSRLFSSCRTRIRMSLACTCLSMSSVTLPEPVETHYLAPHPIRSASCAQRDRTSEGRHASRYVPRVPMPRVPCRWPCRWAGSAYWTSHLIFFLLRPCSPPSPCTPYSPACWEVTKALQNLRAEGDLELTKNLAHR